MIEGYKTGIEIYVNLYDDWISAEVRLVEVSTVYSTSKVPRKDGTKVIEEVRMVVLIGIHVGNFIENYVVPWIVKEAWRIVYFCKAYVYRIVNDVTYEIRSITSKAFDNLLEVDLLAIDKVVFATIGLQGLLPFRKGGIVVLLERRSKVGQGY